MDAQSEKNVGKLMVAVLEENLVVVVTNLVRAGCLFGKKGEVYVKVVRVYREHLRWGKKLLQRSTTYAIIRKLNRRRRTSDKQKRQQPMFCLFLTLSFLETRFKLNLPLSGGVAIREKKCAPGSEHLADHSCASHD